MSPDNPLWSLAQRLAEWRLREGYLDYAWPDAHRGDTLWRDDGSLPSGDTFTLWLACEL